MTRLKNTLVAMAFAAEARIVAQACVGIDDASTDDVPLAPYYVFSRGEGRGFVIVSGDDTTAPILGYTDQGNFDYSTLPEGLKSMLDTWAKKIEKLQQSQDKEANGAESAARRRTFAGHRHRTAEPRRSLSRSGAPDRTADLHAAPDADRLADRQACGHTR